MAFPFVVVATGVVPHPGAAWNGPEGAPPNPLPLPKDCAPNAAVAGALKPPDAAPNPDEDAPGVAKLFGDELNPPFDDPPFGGVGLGGLSQPLFAASSAFCCASGLLPANIIPDSVPVKNVAIGTISSKNF